jgi:hypothetical protein
MTPGLFLGLIGMALALVFAFVPTKVPKQLSQAGLTLGILLVGMGLGLLAAQVRDLTVGIQRLAVRYAVLSNASSPPSSGAPSEPMKMMDDQRLRSRVAALSHAMCDFEHKFQSDELERNLNHPPVVGTQEVVKRQWQTEANLWQRRYEDYENEFRKRFLADALAYREEVLRRLRTVPPDEERQIPALHGNLTGPSPICDLGVYLESLAVQLAP